MMKADAVQILPVLRNTAIGATFESDIASSNSAAVKIYAIGNTPAGHCATCRLT